MVSDVQYDGVDQPMQGTVYFGRTASRSGTSWLSRRKAIRRLSTGDAAASFASSSRARRFPNVRHRSISWSTSRWHGRRPCRCSSPASPGVALLLSVIGIYGVMGYYVQQHMKEISIRIALGGSRGDVAKLVVGQGMTVVVIGGMIVGMAIAFAATRLMSSLLFGVGATDPATFTP